MSYLICWVRLIFKIHVCSEFQKVFKVMTVHKASSFVLHLICWKIVPKNWNKNISVT